MNWFKRLCLFAFGLMGLFALCVLSLSWVGPWTAQVRSLLVNHLFFAVLEVCVCACAFGLLIAVLVALFYPRNPKETIVAEVEGGNITVARQAIVSQVRHIIESDGQCKATSIRVAVRRRGNVRVDVRVKPHVPINVVKYGEELYQKLESGLKEVCGESLKSVNVVFAEPQRIGAQAQEAADGDGVTVNPGSGDGQGGSGQPISVNPAAMGWNHEDDASGEQAAEAYATPEEDGYETSDSWADATDDAQTFETAPTVTLANRADESTSEEV